MLNPETIATYLQRWLQSGPSLSASVPAATRAFCLQRLQTLSDPTLLRHKLECELGAVQWRPLGRILLVVSENDVLGTVVGFVAACLTGNRMRIKAQRTLTILEELKNTFGFDDAECELRAWSSDGQNDAEIIADIDAVLLAGSEELIRHYRQVTPPNVRLIEFGPKISAAAIASIDFNTSMPDWSLLIDALITDVTLFEQQVCSSPQFILVDTMDTAQALYKALTAKLPTLPPLAREQHLLQMARAEELTLRARLGLALSVTVDASTGWGITLNPSFSPEAWLHKGFQLVVGPIAPALTAVAKRYPRQLQTLGEWQLAPELEVAGFTHRCPLGKMHQRNLLAPHDGMLELPLLVNFLSRENHL